MIPPFKVRVRPTESEQIQALVFELNGHWAFSNNTNSNFLDCPYLLYDPEEGLSADDNSNIFEQDELPEYTYEQINNMLNNLLRDSIFEREPNIPVFKIRVNPIQSRNIQDSLFRLGKTWIDGSQNIQDADVPYLFFNYDEGLRGHLQHSHFEDTFNSSGEPEYTYARLGFILQEMVTNLPPVEEREPEQGAARSVTTSGVATFDIDQETWKPMTDSYADDWSGTDRLIDQLNGLLGLNNI